MSNTQDLQKLLDELDLHGWILLLKDIIADKRKQKARDNITISLLVLANIVTVGATIYRFFM